MQALFNDRLIHPENVTEIHVIQNKHLHNSKTMITDHYGRQNMPFSETDRQNSTQFKAL